MAFNLPLKGFQKAVKSSAGFWALFGSEKGQEMLLLPVAEKQGLFLHQSCLGLISLLLTDFFFSLMGGVLLSPQPCARKPQSLVVLGLWGRE